MNEPTLHDWKVRIILDEVCREFKTTQHEIRAHGLRQSRLVPRIAAAVALRKFTPLSLNDIGGILNRDHSTVIHSLKNGAKAGWLPAVLKRIENELTAAERGLSRGIAVGAGWRLGVEIYGTDAL